MRLLTWNCNGALRKKFSLLQPLGADICIVQECENPCTSKNPAYEAWAANHYWIGDNKNRGLGIFARSGIQMELIQDFSEDLKLFLLCRLPHNVQLLAVWTKNSDHHSLCYIGQLYQYVKRHKPQLCAHKTIIIGDWNSNACWDCNNNYGHSDVVKELDDIGIGSLYHYQFQEAFGQESRPTFFMYRNIQKPYHIDYCFIPQTLLSDSQICVENDHKWLERSDHMPVIADISESISN